MSFIRPEAARVLSRWAGTAGWLAALGVILWVGVVNLLSGGLWGWAALILFAPPAAWFAYSAFAHARLAAGVKGPGHVEIRERRIFYLGPYGGSVVDIEALSQVSIVTTDRGPAEDDAFWLLDRDDGPEVLIPNAASGAEALLDAFSALDGFAYAKVVEAMGSTRNASFTIWRRDGGGAAKPLQRDRTIH